MQGLAGTIGAKMPTTMSLAVLLTLQGASEKQAFSKEEFNLPAAEADAIAQVFAKYAPHTRIPCTQCLPVKGMHMHCCNCSHAVPCPAAS